MKNIGLANNGNAAANVLRAKELDAIALAVPSSLAKELRPLASYTAQTNKPRFLEKKYHIQFG